MRTNEGFFQRVYELTRKIPRGRVTTYGAITACLGSPGAARMVGWALNSCGSEEEFVPAHRVVNRPGMDLEQFLRFVGLHAFQLHYCIAFQ